jgi:type I restriction enzyme R subunit
MVTEDRLEVLSVEWFQDTGWSYKIGIDLAPDGIASERADFRTVVLNARLASAVQRLSPQLPPSAIEEVVHVATMPTETSLPRKIAPSTGC